MNKIVSVLMLMFLICTPITHAAEADSMHKLFDIDFGIGVDEFIEAMEDKGVAFDKDSLGASSVSNVVFLNRPTSILASFQGDGDTLSAITFNLADKDQRDFASQDDWKQYRQNTLSTFGQSYAMLNEKYGVADFCLVSVAGETEMKKTSDAQVPLGLISAAVEDNAPIHVFVGWGNALLQFSSDTVDFRQVDESMYYDYCRCAFNLGSEGFDASINDIPGFVDLIDSIN